MGASEAAGERGLRWGGGSPLREERAPRTPSLAVPGRLGHAWPALAGEMPVAGAPGKAKREPRGKGGGEACGGGRKGEGRCHTPLFSLESASGGGRLKNAFLCGLRTLRAWQKGPEIKSSQIRSVCGGHQSHGQRLRAVAERRADSQHRAIFSATLISLWKNKTLKKPEPSAPLRLAIEC